MTEERDRDPTMEELNEAQAAERKASYERTLAALRRVLSNEDGFARIEAISDEEWDTAQALDDKDEEQEADRGAT